MHGSLPPVCSAGVLRGCVFRHFRWYCGKGQRLTSPGKCCVDIVIHSVAQICYPGVSVTSRCFIDRRVRAGLDISLCSSYIKDLYSCFWHSILTLQYIERWRMFRAAIVY